MTYATVRATTSEELEYLRSSGHGTKLYLAIFKPTVIYTARLSAVPSSNDRVVSLTFASGSGTLADVLPDMTLYAGTTAGAYDLGAARIRKAPIAGTFYIGEESEIDWATVVSGGIYLTVVDEFDLWAKHIRTVSDSEFYMDYDVAYTDQNHVFSPVPIMGGHQVKKLEASTVNAVFDFSNSYCLGSSVTGYSSSCPTASGSSGTATSAPTFTFDTEGWHRIVLTVTAANGKTSVGVRYVYVYSNEVPPTTVFQLESCAGEYDNGGWTYRVTMQDEASLAEIPERTLCILFAEDYYNGTKVSIGQLLGCENIICVGKISGEEYNINPEQGEVTLTIQGMQYWMGQIYAFPTGVIQTTGTPANWGEMYSPTVDEVTFRLLHWGSTATKIMDCYLPGDSKVAKGLLSPASNLWAQIQEIAFTSVYARAGVDRFGRLFVEVEPQLVSSGSRTWATVMTITKEDWFDAIRMQRVVVSPTGSISSSGVVITVDGDGSALFSLSPGHVFKRYGQAEVIDRLLLSTQLQSNVLASMFLGWRNNPYPNTEISLAGNYRMIDCFPRQRVVWSVDASDTPRQFNFNTNFIPRRAEFYWEPEGGVLTSLIAIEMESVAQLYTDGDIPGGPDDSEPPSPPAFPDLPDFPVILPTDLFPQGNGPSVVIFHDATAGMILAEDFNTTSPTYTTFNSGLSGLDSGGVERYKRINSVVVCPNGAIYVAYIPAASPNRSFIARAPSAGAAFTMLYDCEDAGVNGGNSDWQIWSIAHNPLYSEQVAFIMGKSDNSRKFYIGANTSFVQKTTVLPSDYRIGFGAQALSYGNSKWLATGYQAQIVFNATGSAITASPTWNTSLEGHIRAGTTGITFHTKGDGSHDFYSDSNNLSAFTLVNSGSDVYIDSIGGTTPSYTDCDPSGSLLMGRALVGVRAKSSDGGATWATLGSLPVGNYYFRYAGNANWWIAAGATIRFTDDWGTTWYNKDSASLLAINPFPDLNIVRVIG